MARTVMRRPATTEGLVGLAAAAARAHVEWRIAWTAVLKGELPAVQIRRRWYVRPADLEAWLTARAARAPAPAATPGGAR